MTGNSQTAPLPPKLLPSLRTGFDAITNHLVLILIPMALDLFLWLGPHLRIQKIIESILAQLLAFNTLQDPAAEEMLIAGQEAWTTLAESLNLFSALRAYPVGIPSLMASMFSLDTPAGTAVIWELNSLIEVVFILIGLTILGLILGTFFYLVVAQATIHGEIRLRQSVQNWPWAALQVILLALIWLALLIIISIPGSCLVSLVALGGFPIGQCALLLYSGAILWLFFPLLFSAHGIFIKHANVISSVKASVRITRYTLPTTGLFFLLVLLISKGLDLLWQVPPPTSWLTIIGLAGHAFIVTGLLAASYIYYRDASYWVDNLLQQSRLSSLPDAVGEENPKT